MLRSGFKIISVKTRQQKPEAHVKCARDDVCLSCRRGYGELNTLRWPILMNFIFVRANTLHDVLTRILLT